MKGEDVGDLRLALQPDEHIEADEQTPADLDDVDRQAIVLRAHPLGRDDGELLPTEGLLATPIQGIGTPPEFAPMFEEPPSDDIVIPAVERGRAARHFGATGRLLIRHRRPPGSRPEHRAEGSTIREPSDRPCSTEEHAESRRLDPSVASAHRRVFHRHRCGPRAGPAASWSSGPRRRSTSRHRQP